MNLGLDTEVLVYRMEISPAVLHWGAETNVRDVDRGCCPEQFYEDLSLARVPEALHRYRTPDGWKLLC